MMTGHRGDLVLGMFFDALGFLTAGLWRDLAWVLKPGHHAWRRVPKAVAKRLLLPAMMAWGPNALCRPIQRRFWSRIADWPRVPPYPDWLRPEFAERVGLAQLARPVAAPDTIREPSRRMRYESIFMEHHARILVEVERMHMHQGLLHSDPWSDLRLVEFVLAIPQHETHRPSEYKRLARLAMKGLMPEEARQKVGKVTLMPLAQSALQGHAHDTIVQLITDSEVVARGYVDEAKLQALHDAAFRGESANGLWEILFLEVWLRRYWR